MRAFADDKASASQQVKKRKVNKEAGERAYQEKQKRGNELTFRSLRNPPVLSTLSAQGDEFLHQRLVKQEQINTCKEEGKIFKNTITYII
jgi:hypothetical protein